MDRLENPVDHAGDDIYQRLIRRIRDYAVFTIDPEGVIASWNEGVERILGYGEDEFVGRPARFVFTPEDRERGVPEHEMEEAARSGHAADDRWHERKDGTRVWIDGSMEALRGDAGEVLGFVKVMRDASERKRAEAELQEERDFLEAILDTLTEAIVVADADGGLLRFNRAARELHGLPAESVPADGWAERYGLFEADGTTPLGKEDVPLYRALQGEVVRDVEMAVRPVGRPARIVSANGQLLTGPGGDTVGAVVAMHDVTERKRAEEALRESEARQRFLAESGRRLASSLDHETTLDNVARLVVPAVADWCVVDLLDEDGTLRQVALTHVDPGKEAWGHELRRRFPANPGAGTGAFHVIRTGRGELLPEISDDVLRTAARDDEHLELLRKVGMRSVITVPLALRERALGAITLILAESGRTYGPADLALAEELARRAAIAVDNARLYHEAHSLNEQLESRVEQRTAALEAAVRELETFAYSVSHDLRAPLRGIDGFSQALLEDHGDALGVAGKAYLDRIRSGAQRMGELIDDLLDFSRLARSDMQRDTVDLSGIATSIARKLQEERPERTVDFDIARGVEAYGDERLLRIVLENLLENAWKFTRERERAAIGFGVGGTGDRPVYFVRDDGAGFDMEYAGKLFTPFQRLHSPGRFEGTGIGLATVQRIVHRHGGAIWAESEIGAGATFFFTLPPAEEGAEGAGG